MLVRLGMHFVGVGADGPERHELPESLFAGAAVIATDDQTQCMALGDFGRAVRAKQVHETTDQSLGNLLSKSSIERTLGAIFIIDLTGIAAQDIAIDNVFAKQFSE